MVNHHEFKSVWELGLMISDENNNQSQPSRTHTHTNKVHVISFIMLFILTIGYIGKVYKSVSSKRKPTRPSVGNVCVILLLLFMCELDRDAGSPLLLLLLLLLLFTPQTSSGLPALSALYKVKISACFCEAELVVAL